MTSAFTFVGPTAIPVGLISSATILVVNIISSVITADISRL
jgi:hypothetical protein